MWNKNKIKSFFFDLNTFNEENFVEFVLGNLKVGITYSLLLRIKYFTVSPDGFVVDEDASYGMAGKQIGFKLSGINDVDRSTIKSVYNDFSGIVSSFIVRYDVGEIDFIQILYIIVSDRPELKLRNINQLSLNREFVNIKETRSNFSSKYLPLTTNNSYYGEYLVGNVRLTYVDIINKQKSLLNPKKDLLSDNDIESMYFYNGYIIVNYNIVKKDLLTVYSREVYSSNTGMLYFTVEDTVKDINYPNVFTRKIGNSIFNIISDKITGFEAKKELVCISNKDREYKAASNPFIGTIDLETYRDTDGYSKVYALGFYVHLIATLY